MSEREHITTGTDCWCHPVIDSYGADHENDGLIPINSWDEIPEFASDDDAYAFWSTHCYGPALLETLTETTRRLYEHTERDRQPQ